MFATRLGRRRYRPWGSGGLDRWGKASSPALGRRPDWLGTTYTHGLVIGPYVSRWWQSAGATRACADHDLEAALDILRENRTDSLATLLARVRACNACAPALPLGPRPVLQASASATILIASQAPGAKVHQTGVPFSDASGDRLREWMGVAREDFYDERIFAILPMGFCYPGRAAGGDAPPRPECERLWRGQLMRLLPSVRLALLVGTYAQNYLLEPGTMTGRVRDFRDYLPQFFPLPHPSWRSRMWEKKNPWFRDDVLPALRCAIERARSAQGPESAAPR